MVAPGTRTPPSKSVFLAPRRGQLLPPSAGEPPLSEAKTMMALLSCALIAASLWVLAVPVCTGSYVIKGMQFCMKIAYHS